MIVINITFEYEVAYSIDSECSSDSLPDDGYTVYSPRTTNTSIEVFGLMSDTCYVFGVRAHTSLSTSPGPFSVINKETVSEGIIYNCLRRIAFNVCYYSVVTGFSAVSFIERVELTWSVLEDVSIDEYWYEIGIAAYTDAQECSSVSPTTLPRDYMSYTNTSDGRVEVTGLIPNTCYVFGVRVYSLRTGQPGQWNVKANATLADGEHVRIIIHNPGLTFMFYLLYRNHNQQ